MPGLGGAGQRFQQWQLWPPGTLRHLFDSFADPFGSALATLAGGNGGRTGYFRIDVSGLSAPIISMKLDGHICDA